MPTCEMCGSDNTKCKRTFVDGALMMICPNCAKFGKEVKAPPAAVGRPAPSYARGGDLPMVTSVRPKRKDVLEATGGKELAHDFHKRISSARNKLGMTQDELAKMLNERKSVIGQLESGKIRPDDKLRRKLERVLKISLLEAVDDSGPRRSSSTRNYTIGDILKDQ